jgi:hypothetical protein
MDKIVLDTFTPDPACFDPPPTDPSKKDGCTVEVAFHDRENPSASQPKLSFQREKDHYIFAPGSVGIPVAQALGFDEKNASVQSAVHFTVFLNGWFKNNYPDFKTKKSYTGSDLLPLSARSANFIAAGDIESPDTLQRKKTSSLLRELLALPDGGKLWFNTMFGTLNDSNGNQKLVPLPMRPRVQWLIDQMKFQAEFRKGLSLQGKEGEDLRAELTTFGLDLQEYLATGEGNLKDIRATMDRLAERLGRADSTPNELKDLYAFLLKNLEPMGKNPWLDKNSEARQRFNTLTGVLRLAVQEKRAELLRVDPDTAFRLFLKNELMNSAKTNNLDVRVKAEMETAHLDPDWLKDNAKEIVEAVVPHLTLVEEKDKTPRVKVDLPGMEESIRKMVSQHGVQEREYRIGALAVLRFLFGRDLNEGKMKGWMKNQRTEIDIDMSAADQKRLQKLGERLNKNISKSQVHTDVILPIGEGLVLAGGVGMTVAGHLLDGNDRTPLNVIGPTVIGLGTGSLICHFAWKSRNPFLTDATCGAGGAGAGFAVGWLTTQPPKPKPPAGPRIDGRNPVKPYGP